MQETNYHFPEEKSTTLYLGGGHPISPDCGLKNRRQNARQKREKSLPPANGGGGNQHPILKSSLQYAFSVSFDEVPAVLQGAQK